MMTTDFGEPFTIPAFDTVYLLGAGASFDLFLDKYPNINRNSSIIITCNNMISFVKPTFQVCGDTETVEHWSKHPNNDQSVMWIARPTRLPQYARLCLNYINSDTLFGRYDLKFAGCGSEAFYLAYYLSIYAPIKKIIYTGIDFSFVRLNHNSNRYFYASRPEVKPSQSSEHLPLNWRSKNWTVSINSDRNCYMEQLRCLSVLCSTDKEFTSKLICESGLDLSYLHPGQLWCGYDQSFKNGIFKR